jgi:NADH:ubiquinone oxidoreductase subunit 4 (subunit M)
MSFFQGLSESNSSSQAKVSNLEVVLGVDGLSLSFVLLIGVVLPIVY